MVGANLNHHLEPVFCVPENSEYAMNYGGFMLNERAISRASGSYVS